MPPKRHFRQRSGAILPYKKIKIKKNLSFFQKNVNLDISVFELENKMLFLYPNSRCNFAKNKGI